MRKASAHTVFILVVVGIILLVNGNHAVHVTVDPDDKQHEARRIDDEESVTPNQFGAEASDNDSRISATRQPPLDLHEKVVLRKTDRNYDHDHDMQEEAQCHPNKPTTTSSGHQCRDEADRAIDSESNPDSSGADRDHRPPQETDHDVVKCPDDDLNRDDSSTGQDETCSTIDKKGKKSGEESRKASISEAEADRSEVVTAESPSPSLSSAPRGEHQDLSVLVDLVSFLVLLGSMVIVCYLLTMGILRAMEEIYDYLFNWEDL